VKPFYFEIETDRAVGNTLVMIGPDSDELLLTIDHPWAGDSISGFGCSLTETLSREQATEVRDAIDAWLRTTSSTPPQTDAAASKK